jgi:glutamyl-tRNA reductase
MLDLSVPRNIEPRLGLHPQITLMNMEELGQFIEKQQQYDEAHIQQAQAQVWKQVERHLKLFNLKSELRAILSCD